MIARVGMLLVSLILPLEVAGQEGSADEIPSVWPDELTESENMRLLIEPKYSLLKELSDNATCDRFRKDTIKWLRLILKGEVADSLKVDSIFCAEAGVCSSIAGADAKMKAIRIVSAEKSACHPEEKWVTIKGKRMKAFPRDSSANIARFKHGRYLIQVIDRATRITLTIRDTERGEFTSYQQRAEFFIAITRDLFRSCLFTRSGTLPGMKVESFDQENEIGTVWLRMIRHQADYKGPDLDSALVRLYRYPVLTIRFYKDLKVRYYRAVQYVFTTRFDEELLKDKPGY